MYLHLILREKIFCNFSYKTHHVCIYIKYVKSCSYKNLFFHFLFYNTFTVKLYENTFLKKIVIFFQLKSSVGQTTFNFHSFNKVNDFAATQYATTIFYLHCVKCVQIRSFYRFTFSRIRTQYGETQSISPYSVQM